MSDKSKYVRNPDLSGWRVYLAENVSKTATHTHYAVHERLGLRTSLSKPDALRAAIQYWARSDGPGLTWDSFRAMRNRYDHFKLPVRVLIPVADWTIYPSPLRSGVYAVSHKHELRTGPVTRELDVMLNSMARQGITVWQHERMRARYNEHKTIAGDVQTQAWQHTVDSLRKAVEERHRLDKLARLFTAYCTADTVQFNPFDPRPFIRDPLFPPIKPLPKMQDLIGKAVNVQVVRQARVPDVFAAPYGVQTGRMSSAKPQMESVQRDADSIYQGHSSDGSSIQKHSIGGDYPYIIVGFQYQGETWYGWMNPAKRTASVRMRSAQAAQDSLEYAKSLAWDDPKNALILAAAKEHFVKLHGYGRHAAPTLIDTPFKRLVEQQAHAAQELKRAENAFQASVKEFPLIPDHRISDVVWRISLDGGAAPVWRHVAPVGRKWIQDAQGTWRRIVGVHKYGREK